MAGEFAHFRIMIGGKEVDAATMRDGKVVHLREYLDSGKLLARLGHATAVGGGG
jgi:hypothetical protein